MAATSGGSIVWNLTAESSAFSAGLNKASTEAKNFGNGLEKGLGDASKNMAQKVRENFLQISAALVGLGVGVNKLTGFMKESVESANKQQAAFIGLGSVAKAFGADIDEATAAARSLSKDGLMTVGDAAKGLKNLLASGFSLPQATKLLERFKDSASFGRQSALSFGDAVTSATEGIKNGNSILVDNAGVTKNLSVILKEAGFGADDLMNATTDANVRLALFNGILKETNPQVGDAAKYADTAAGKQAMFAQKTDILKSKIGESLQPALLKLLETLTPMIEKFAKFVEENPKVVAAVLIIGAVLGSLVVTLGAVGLAVSALSPIFSLFAAKAVADTGTVAAAQVGLRGLVGTPMILPALAIGAVLASIALMVKSYFDAKNAIEAASNALKNRINSDKDVINKLLYSIDFGTAEQRARALKTATGLGLNLSAGVQTPQFASGTDYFKGGTAIVGERGPEIVNLPRGSEVIPNNKIESQGQSNQYHIGTINISSEVDGQRWLQKLTRDQYDVSNGLVPSRGAA